MSSTPPEPPVETFIQEDVARGIRFDRGLIDLLAGAFCLVALLGGTLKILTYYADGRLLRSAFPIISVVALISYLAYRAISLHWLSSRLVKQASFRQSGVELTLVGGSPLFTTRTEMLVAPLAKAPVGSLHRLGKLKIRKLALPEGSVFIAEEWRDRLCAPLAESVAHPPHGT